jgi:hypothetical protein
VLRGLLILSLAIGIPAGARAIELSLDARALAAAIDIGQSRLESVRTRFHRPYHFLVSAPPVDSIDVVTPFRRIVLAAESRARIGDRSYAQREALATLSAGPQQVDLVVELTFHPLNTYVGVPDYRVQLLAAATRGAAAIEPVSVQRVPRYGPRMSGQPLPYPYPLLAPTAPGSVPLTGGMVIASLDGSALADRGRYDVLVVEEGKELARVRVDFGNLR